MFRDLPQYELRSDRDIPWMPPLPRHWSIERGKALFRRVQREPNASDGVVTCFRDGVVTLRSRRRTTGFTESLKEIGYQGIRRGDLVIHAMDAFAGAVGVSDSNGKGTPVYSVCVPRGKANPYYFAGVVREMARTSWIHSLAKGVRERSTDFRFDAFAVQQLPVPPVEEQAAIVKYLAHANARIDNVIAAKRRLIALLEEQMRVLVESAISECTASLERLGFHIDLVTGFPFKSEDFRTTGGDGQRPLLRGINVGVGSLSSTDYVFVDEDIAQLAQSFELRAGDLVLGMDRPVIAKGVRLAEITSQQAGCLLVQRVARLRTKSTLEPSYLQTVFRSAAFTQYLEPIFTGISVPHLSPKQIRDFPLPMPTIDEQRAIVAAVGSSTTKLESAVNVAAREVVLLQEFRTRLVADVVTGQVDVRAVAATLPNAPTSVLVADDVPAEADGPWENDDE